MFPLIIINRKKLIDNIENVLKMSRENNIPYITFVVKAFSGNEEILSIINSTSLKSIGDSRIENLKKFQSLPIEKMLLRIPMLSEVRDVIKYADISLNSELSVIEALNAEAKAQNKIHDILIMFDLGDLREGLYYKSDYLPFIEKILSLQNINIKGIGTNLTCYGGLIPDEIILNRLVQIKNKIENGFSIKLDIISGGNSSSVTLFNQNIIPKEINHLRLGESILFGKETSYSKEIKGLNHDVFLFQAEIIECKTKPSFPDGTITINSFGEVPQIEDKGMITRLILAIGKQDVILENLVPIDENLSILGGSSDHLILESKNNKYKVGNIVTFKINYPALVHLMNSNYVKKDFQ